MGRAQPERRPPSLRLYLLMQLFIGVWKVEVRFRTSNRGDSDGKAVRRREFVYDIG